jgi:hypothetical protein
MTHSSKCFIHLSVQKLKIILFRSIFEAGGFLSQFL